MAKNRVVGQARVTVSSLGLLDTDGQTTIEIGGPKRDAVQGDYQAGSWRETTEPSKIECSILVKENTSLSAVRAVEDDTITVEFDTGQTFIVRNGYSSEVPSVATNDGKAKIVFGGPPAEEML